MNAQKMDANSTEPIHSVTIIVRYASLIVIIWTCLIAVSCLWSIQQRKVTTTALMTKEAHAHFNKDVSIRLWVTSHGGVYVPTDERTPPNPNLKHLSERDISTPSGKKLTLMSPAYMLRQIMEDYSKLYGIRGRITSLKPFRPQNAPDEWERSALTAFENGVEEVFEFVEIDGEPYLRLIQPMITEQGCLECHGYQDYKVGDVRGGVGVSVPMSPYLIHERREIRQFVITHILVWLIGIVGIYFGFLGVRRYFIEHKQNEERYRQTVEISIDGFWIIDTKGKLLSVNAAYCNMIGHSRDELLNMSVLDVEALFSQAEIEQRIEEVIRQGSGRFETKHQHKNGNIIDVEISTTYTKDGSDVFFVFIRDITERKLSENLLLESEQRFKSLFDNAPLSYQSLDGEGYFTEVNETWLNLLEYTREEVIGRNFSELLHPDWQDHFKANFSKFKAVGEIMGVEFEMRKKGGSYISISLQGKIGRTSNGEFKQTHCVFKDITQQKQIEEENKVLEKRLQQSQRMESIGNLAGGIAHDFNNILFPIIGFSEMLMEDLPEGSMGYENVQEILQAGKRGRDIVKQILSFSRQTEHEMLPIKVQMILKEVLKLSRSTIPSNIVIDQDIQNDCGPVKADPSQVHQVAMNLITNAYHAVEQTGGKISVQLREIILAEDDFAAISLSPGKYVRISFVDTGCGIGADVIDRVFDPYFTTKAQGKGSGLGLAVVYGIIKEHDGDIKVYSEVGKGTNFTVYLPLVAKSSPIVSAFNVKPDETGTERILLVDDEVPIARLEKQMLERLGYHVTFCTASLEALGIFKGNPDKFDLVVTDMTMPDMTGDKLAKELISIRPDIPIIICTGFSEMLSDEKSKTIGIKGFLMKPVVKSELAQKVRKILDEPKGHPGD
ncbi:PAS domain S-box protein [Desulfobacterales bacterium HSG17]|nr:PAS domain S-box protein [Desulfobacterales bacterium HSG17]